MKRLVTPALVLTLLGALLAAAVAVGVSLALLTDTDSVPGNTFTTAASFGCTAGDTGFLDPSAQAADTGGDGDGFEGTPTNAFADGGGIASNIDGDGDRHRYFDYGISIASDCIIPGIAVQLDWYLDDTAGNNKMQVELSWDGGTSWTVSNNDSQETTTEHTAILGGAADTWGRTWTPAELSDANFRVRIETTCSGSASNCDPRDYFLDWVPVRVYYDSGSASAALTGTLVPSATEAEIVAGGDTLVITLTNDTWDTTVGADNAITTALINGIDSDLTEDTGWDAVVKAGLTFNEVVRTSDTVVTITLPAFGTFDIGADETITVTVPASAVASATAIVATPTFAVVAASASGIAQVQVATGATSGSDPSVTASYGAAPTQDNLLVLVHHYRGDDTVTLPAGWTEAVVLVDSFATITIAYKIAGAAEGTGVTVSVSVSGHQTLTILEYSGIDTVSPLDQTSSNACGFNSCSTGTTGTTSVADELVIAGIGLNGTSGGWANTWTNGFTQQSTLVSSGGSSGAKSESSTADRIVSATGTFETTESWTNNRAVQGAIATFKAAP